MGRTIVLSVCTDRDKTVREELKMPVRIEFEKEDGISIDPKLTIQGPAGGVFAGMCALVCGCLKALDPDNREMQEKIMDLMYESVLDDLKLSGKENEG